MTDPFAAAIPWKADAEDVKTTASGLQYVVLKSGDASGTSPTAEDRVVVHYDGRLAADGKKFDSSYDRGEPATFPAGGLIPGWVEALQLMKPGDEWMLYIPSKLGYGERGAGATIPPNSDLVFRVALQDVVKAKKPDAEAWSKYSPWPKDSADVNTTASGLQYVVIASGDPAGPHPRAQDEVDVNYEGRLADGGQFFDSSYQYGRPATFPTGRLIPGWVEGLQLMRPGDRWMMFIPSDLAYGKAGAPPAIPPNADLIFEVELEKVHAYD